MLQQPIYKFEEIFSDKVLKGEKHSWNTLSANPNAIHIIDRNFKKVHWSWLSRNPNAIHMLEKKFE